ncbi:MAG: PAS domain S-box protein, partial [Thermodesulfovibrionales bacterium]|nr:PAS domain S-box protein [Thermodesulfovibrionales bacterium]
MKTVPEKLSMEGKGLRDKLTIIASLLFLLPSFVVLYILYKENISLRSDNAYLVLIGLTLVLALAGLIILRKVFSEFILISGYMKKAEAGEMYMMEVQKSTAELHDISVSFNNLMRKLEATTKRLEEQTFELKEETIKRKRAEEGLLLMVKAVENTKTGITFADRDNVIRYTNPAEAKMHGYAQEELIGKSVRIFSPPGMGRPIAFEDMNAIKGWARESVNIKKDGSIFPVYLISDLVKNDDGEPIGIVTICEDMTESKRVQKELEEAYAHVFHTGRLSQLGEMAMGIAREINLLL